MSYLDFSRYVVTASSILLSVGLYHQVYKMFKTKSSDDFSVLMLLALLVCQLSWINYGLLIKEWPILFLSIVELPAGILALYGCLKYRKKEVLNEKY